MYEAGGDKLPMTLLIVLKSGKTRDCRVKSVEEKRGGLVVRGTYITTGYSKRFDGNTKVLDPQRSKHGRASFFA